MIVYRFSPAACPVAKAICRLKPPVYASTSRISPASTSPELIWTASSSGRLPLRNAARRHNRAGKRCKAGNLHRKVL